MTILYQTDPTTQALDAAAIIAADLRHDADQGDALLADLESKWFDQGRAAAIANEPIAVCWNDPQRAGYRFQQWLTGEDRAIAVRDWPVLHRVEQTVFAQVTRYWGGEAA